ncbi:MAG: hypothetical protein AAGC60_15915 [Acidobacteriota bacterium]
MNRNFALVLGTFSLILVAAVPLAAQCPSLQLRVWQPGGEETWSASGEGVRVTTGEEAHVYLHVEGRSATPYGTSATIGYPQQYGASGSQRDVLEHVRMKAQSVDDKRLGRIRFTAEEPGTTQLGYRVTAVSAPGTLQDLPAGCREGFFAVEVLSATDSTDGDGANGGSGSDGDAATSRGAAQELAAGLVGALLRRDGAYNLDSGFVDRIARDGRDGVIDVAQTVVTSNEFRSEALRRTEEAHGRADLSRLRELLLDDIYRDLYGYVEPSRDDADDDLAALDECLSASRDSVRACEDLAANLVASRLFYEHHRDLIDQLR